MCGLPGSGWLGVVVFRWGCVVTLTLRAGAQFASGGGIVVGVVKVVVVVWWGVNTTQCICSGAGGVVLSYVGGGFCPTRKWV